MVLFLLAVVAGAAALKAGPAMGRVKAKDLANRIADFDRLARLTAREQDRPLQIVVDLDGGRLRLADTEGRDLSVPPLELPSGCWFGRFLMRGQEMERGSLTISCSREGFSPSYAVRLNGPGGQSAWVIFCGLTGSVVREQDSDSVHRGLRETFSAVAPRNDSR